MTAPRIVQSKFGDVRLGSFKEVISIPGRYLNDHCLIRHDKTWHIFAIHGDIRTPESPIPIESSIFHATSPDLFTWNICPNVIESTGEWPEVTNVYAPSVIAHDGSFFMLYCANDTLGTQRICLATSTDLFNWTRYEGNPVIVPSLSWAKWPGFGLPSKDEARKIIGEHGSTNIDDHRRFVKLTRGTYGGCRDPHINKLPNGQFVAYWVSRLNESFGHNQVCVAASLSHDLVHWQEIGPVYSQTAWPLAEEPTLEVESPCIVYKDKLWWLFFKHGWCTHVTSSTSPLDFRDCEVTQLGFVHAAEIFQWNNEWFITHCSGDSDDYKYRRSNRTRGLFLGKLDWPTGSPPILV